MVGLGNFTPTRFVMAIWSNTNRSLVFTAFMFVGGSLFSQPFSSPRDDFWVPDGEVKTIVETNGIVYIGGKFDYVSPVSETGNAFDLDSGASLPNFPKISGAIRVIMTDNAGGWFVGGLFTSVGGLPVTNLAHIRADKTVDTNWTPNPDNAVLALAYSRGILYAGGSFRRIAGDDHSLLAALNSGTGAAVPGWLADVRENYVPPSVNALAVSDGVLYVGGTFNTINGIAREHIGAVDAATGNTTGWHPNGYTGAEVGARVDALAVSGKIIYVGGTFASLGGVQTNGPIRKYIAALDVTRDLASSVLPWNPNASGPVSSIAVSCDTVYVGGSFTNIGGQARGRVAALEMATGLATAWNPNANGEVLSVTLSGNTLYIGGKFAQVGGQPREFLAALEIHTGEATLWHPKADFGVAVLAVSGGSVVAGGALGPGGKQRKNAAAFDARTGKPTDWSPQIEGGTLVNVTADNAVYSLTASSNLIYLGGPFTSISGQDRNHAGAVDATSGAVMAWNPNANGIVETLNYSGDTVYAGGLFTTIGGQTRLNLAALDPITGNAIAGWSPDPSDKVNALFAGSALFAGGRFTQIGGTARKRVAALTTATGAPTSWNPGVDDEVSTLAVSGNTVFLGGQFSIAAGQPANRIAAIDAISGALTCWKPEARSYVGSTERSAAVNGLLVQSNVVYAGGSFSWIGGQPRNNLAALSADCPGDASNWNPNVDRPVNSLASARGSLFVGGTFLNVGGQYRPSLAVFAPIGSPRIVAQPQSQSALLGQSVTFIASSTGQDPLIYQWQVNGTNLAGATGPIYTIPSAQVTNSGEYTVVVTNALGLVNSRPAILTVLQPLTIVTEPASQTVSPGSTVILTVVATGNPPPIYQWRPTASTFPERFSRP